MKKDPKYWQDLLAQYKRGDISQEDRYTLEKEALDDPFLFDALEGFALHGENTIVKNTTKSRTIYLRRIASVAAVVTAILAAVYLMRSEDTSGLSSQDGSVMAANHNSEEYPQRNETNNQESIPAKSKDQKSITAEGEVADQIGKMITETEAPKTQPSKATATVTRATRGNADQMPNGEENSQMEDATAESEPSPVKEEQTEVIGLDIESDSNESAAEDLTESSAASGSANKASKKKSTFYNVVPMIGNKDFDDYVRQRIKERGLQQDPPQEVTIEFSIDADGNLSEFLHIYEGCSECGPFAISILSSSGVWKTVPAGQMGRARYTFMF